MLNEYILHEIKIEILNIYKARYALSKFCALDNFSVSRIWLQSVGTKENTNLSDKFRLISYNLITEETSINQGCISYPLEKIGSTSSIALESKVPVRTDLKRLNVVGSREESFNL